MRSPLARMTLWDSDAPILATSSLPTAICDLIGSSLALPPAQMSGTVDFDMLLGVNFPASFPDGPCISRSRASERGGAPADPEHTCQVTVSPRSRLQGSKSSSNLTGFFQPAERCLSPISSMLAAEDDPVVAVDGGWTEADGAGGCFGALGAQMAAIDESFSLLSWCGSGVIPALQQDDLYTAESESLEHEVLLPLARSLDFTNHSQTLDSSLHALSPQATLTSLHHHTSLSPQTNMASIFPRMNVPGSPSLNPCCPLSPSASISHPASAVPALVPAASVLSSDTEREDCRWSAMIPVAMSMLAAHMPVEKVMEQLLHYDSFIAATQLAIRNVRTLQLDPAPDRTGAGFSNTFQTLNIAPIQGHPSASSGYGFAVGMDNTSCSYSVLGQPLGAVLLKFHARVASHAALKQVACENPAPEANTMAYTWKGRVQIKPSKCILPCSDANPHISSAYPGGGFDSKCEVATSHSTFEQSVVNTKHTPHQPQVLQPSRYMPTALTNTTSLHSLPTAMVQPAPRMHGATQQLTAAVAQIDTPTLTTIAPSYSFQRPPRPILHTAVAHVGDTHLHAHTTTTLSNLSPTAVNQTPIDESSTLTLPTTRSSGAGAARTSSQGGGGGSSTGRPSHCGSSNQHDLDHEDNEDSDDKSDDKDEGVMWGKVEEEACGDQGQVSQGVRHTHTVQADEGPAA